MIRTEIQPEPIIEERKPETAEVETEVSVLDLLVVLLQRKRFIMRFVVGAAVLSSVVALLLPVSYEGKILLLPPQQNSSIGSAFLAQLGGLGALGSLSSLAGGGLNLKNPADMYVSLLTSRTVEDAMIQRFDLMNEYHKKRLTDTRKELERRTTIVAGSKDGLIRLTLEDRDPKRAAELANGYVEEFRRLSATLAITEAARRRLFFEQQVQQAKDKLTEAEEAMTKTQQSTGVLQIDSQARSLIESAAILRAEVVAKQFEVAKLDEAREGAMIQVVDAAVPPDKKSFPPRTLIVMASTILAFFISVFWVFQREKFARAFELPENRQRLRTIKGLWRGKQKTVYPSPS